MVAFHIKIVAFLIETTDCLYEKNILIEMKAFPVIIKHFLMKMIAFLPNLLKGMIALLIEIKVFLLEMIDFLSKMNYLLKTHFFFLKCNNASFKIKFFL